MLLGACLLSYGNGLVGGFTYDDKAIVRDNPRIRSPRAAEKILTTDYFGRERGRGTNYRPMLLASFALQWWVHGRRAFAFHAVNLLLHMAATLLLARLFRRSGFSLPVAGGAALLFAVHPVHVEAVTSLVGRGETLAAIFVLLYLLWTLPDPNRPARLRVGRLIGALGCYLLGILTKESAAVAPALLFLLLFLKEEGSSRRRIARAFARGLPAFIGSAAVLAGVFALRAWVLGGALRAKQLPIFALENPLAGLDLGDRVANASAIVFRYLGRTVFPLLLSADESAWSIPLLAGSWTMSAAVAFLVLLAALSVVRIRQNSVVAFGVLFFGLALLPTSNLLFPIGTVFAERLLYLPSAGVCLILAAWILGARPPRVLPRAEHDSDGLPGPLPVSRGRVRVLAAVALLFAARTVLRNPVWETDLSLFTNTLHVSPSSAKANYNLAYTVAEEGDTRGALRLFARAVQIFPNYFDAWAGKGRIEKQLGKLADAETSYLRALKAQPAYENGYFGLGLVREERGDLKAAARTYEEGLAKKADSLPLAYRLALARSRLEPESAEKDWARALKIGPLSAAVHLGRAEWLLLLGRRAEARREGREALRREPLSLPALRFLAERNAEEGRLFAEGLAREKIFRLTRSRSDLIPLLRVARRSPEYAGRFRTVRALLARSAPWAFRASDGEIAR